MDFNRLRDLLEAKDWRAADEETARCMMKAMEEQSVNLGVAVNLWLYPEDIEKFPCKALRTLDELWMEYSQGRFGLSVQAQIWRSCGSPTSYLSKAWENFGVTVGWRTQTPDSEPQTEHHPSSEFRWNQAILDLRLGWLSYSQLSFNESAPKGHLPVFGNRTRTREGPLLIAGWQPFHDSENGCYRPRRPLLFSCVETCHL